MKMQMGARPAACALNCAHGASVSDSLEVPQAAPVHMLFLLAPCNLPIMRTAVQFGNRLSIDVQIRCYEASAGSDSPLVADSSS